MVAEDPVDDRWLAVAVLTAELFELTPKWFPVVTVPGLLRPHFSVERRTEFIE